MAVSFLSLLLSAGGAQAVDYFWDFAGPGDWNNGANWSPVGPPSGGFLNNAWINNGGVATISADIPDLGDIHVGAGAGSVGTLNQTGGSTVAGLGWMWVGQGGGWGAYNLSGGTQNKGQLFIGHSNGTGELNVSNTGTIVNNSLQVGVTGGSGQVTMTGGAIHTGTMNLVNGAFDMTGGVLSATTYIGDLTQDGGTTSPGSSPGLMTINGNYSLNGGDLFIELAGLTAGTEYDQLAVAGDVSLAGGLTLSLLPGFMPTVGDIFTIIDNQGPNPVSGNFLEGTLISAGGYDFDIDYTGGDGNDVMLTVAGTTARVPVPGVLVLLITGLAAAAYARHRGPASLA